MIDTLKAMATGLIDWFLGLLKIKNTSEVGFSALTGDGNIKINGNGGSIGPDWTTIVLFVIFGVALYLTPSPLQRASIITTPIPVEVLVPGKSDTVWVVLPMVSGKDSTTQTQPIAVPEMVELVTDKEDANAHVYIRTSAYPTIQDDSLHITMWHEYNIQPRGLEIQTTDTLRLPYAVLVEVDVPFIEKPYVVAPVTAALTLGIVYIIKTILK